MEQRQRGRLQPDEAVAIEKNLFPAARSFVRRNPDFPWHRKRGCGVTAKFINSSQALAIDFFETIRSLDSAQQIFAAWSDHLGFPIKGDWQLKLEKLVPRDLLREKHRTQIDAFARGSDGLILFECKFTEADGGACSQPVRLTDGPHKGMKQCNGKYEMQENPVNKKRARCALTGKRIRYWDFVGDVMNIDPGADYNPCPFKGGNYQWMRNLVAARAMSIAERVPAYFVVAYADGPFPIATKFSTTERGELDRLLAGQKVPMKAVSYQKLNALALGAAATKDRGTIADLEEWLGRKIAMVSRRTNSMGEPHLDN